MPKRKYQDPLLSLKQKLWTGLDPPWPEDKTDLTAGQQGQEVWSIHHLPEILYVLKPSPEHVRSKAPVPKAPYTVFGKEVRDFPILPRRISSRVEGWRLEAWSRMDRRLKPQDFVDRMNPRWAVDPAVLNYRRSSWRMKFGVAAWGSGSSIKAVTLEMRRRGLDPEKNTTRGMTPGLIDPIRGEAGGQVSFPGDWMVYAHPLDWLAPFVQSLQHVFPVQLETSRSPSRSLSATRSASFPPPEHANLFSSFQTSLTKKGVSEAETASPVKRRRVISRSVPQRREQPAQPTQNSMVTPNTVQIKTAIPSTAFTFRCRDGDFTLETDYPDPADHELTYPRPNCAFITETSNQEDEEDEDSGTSEVCTYSKYLQHHKITFKDHLHLQEMKYEKLAEKFRALRLRSVPEHSANGQPQPSEDHWLVKT